MTATALLHCDLYVDEKQEASNKLLHLTLPRHTIINQPAMIDSKVGCLSTVPALIFNVPFILFNAD